MPNQKNDLQGKRSQPFCVIPFSKCFVLSDGIYRDCCITTPATTSKVQTPFDTWWNSSDINNIRQIMWDETEPSICKTCTIGEQVHGTSFRTAVNKELPNLISQQEMPQGWHIMFGNVCNLACWTCNETFSSTIAQHKKNINILPENFVDPEQEFLKIWPDLKDNIFRSYQHHEKITISLLGGEPVYNKTVIEFLNQLVDTGLSKCTRLELTTNGTKLNNKLLAALDRSNWDYICVFVSVDAVGPKAEWLRYGTDWSVVETNIQHYLSAVHYVEIQTTLSILNLADLPSVFDFCQLHNIPNKIAVVSYPESMDIRKWNGDCSFVDRKQFTDRNLDQYIDLLGSTPTHNSKQVLSDYIKKFDAVRKPIESYDSALAALLK
jgi:organic radical activating enzyme